MNVRSLAMVASVAAPSLITALASSGSLAGGVAASVGMQTGVVVTSTLAGTAGLQGEPTAAVAGQFDAAVESPRRWTLL